MTQKSNPKEKFVDYMKIEDDFSYRAITAPKKCLVNTELRIQSCNGFSQMGLSNIYKSDSGLANDLKEILEKFQFVEKARSSNKDKIANCNEELVNFITKVYSFKEFIKLIYKL